MEYIMNMFIEHLIITCGLGAIVGCFRGIYTIYRTVSFRADAMQFSRNDTMFNKSVEFLKLIASNMAMTVVFSPLAIVYFWKELIIADYNRNYDTRIYNY